MTRGLVVGAVIGALGYTLYKYKTTEATQLQSGGSPSFFTSFNLADPYLYVAIVAGAVVGRFVA
jgi:hypothetical protein